MHERDSCAFRLFVAGRSDASQKAEENARRILAGPPAVENGYELEVVDILAEPAEAEAAGVVTAPTLVRISPAPGRRIVGDLSEEEKIRMLLAER